MRSSDKTINAFFALLKAGLWEKSVMLLPYEPLDFDALYRLADAQAVVGLLAAGLEFVDDRKVTKTDALPFLKRVFSLENRNDLMNQAIDSLVLRMRTNGIYTLLIRGQGVAQCYARPHWRSAGDIDLLLDSKNYEKAKNHFMKEGVSMETERVYTKHLGMTIDSWTVELHGSLRCGLSRTIDRVLDSIQEDIFKGGNVRTWHNGETDVILPAVDSDVLIVFTHILSHYYKGGIGIRQVCDWCRLLWMYWKSIDIPLLEKRLKEMRLVSEWKAFAALAIDYLGMPADRMPLYDSSLIWSRKATRIKSFILKVGNFGQNRDMSYYKKYPYVIRKAISFKTRVGDLLKHAMVFPWGSFRFLPTIVYNGLRSAARGE